jgi:hypothetical protein
LPLRFDARFDCFVGMRNPAPRRRLVWRQINQTNRSFVMALAFQEAYAPPIYEDEKKLSPEIEDHVPTYRKFVRWITIGFCGVPFLIAFVLYWLN